MRSPDSPGCPGGSFVKTVPQELLPWQPQFHRNCSPGDPKIEIQLEPELQHGSFVVDNLLERVVFLSTIHLQLFDRVIELFDHLRDFVEVLDRRVTVTVWHVHFLLGLRLGYRLDVRSRRWDLGGWDVEVKEEEKDCQQLA